MFDNSAFSAAASPNLSRSPDIDKFASINHPEQCVMHPNDRIAAWKRWEMNSFTEGLPALSLKNLSAKPMSALAITSASISQNELDALREQAQTDGEKAGYQQGQAQGFEQGYAQGQTEGHAAAMAAVHEQARQLQALALSLPSALHAADASVADDLLALAMDLARQVVGQTLHLDPQAMLAVVRSLLQAEPALVGTPLLFLHPDDAALVKEHLAEDLQTIGWRIRIDADMARGGCRVKANSGERDASLQTRWDRVAAALALHTPLAAGQTTGHAR